MKINIYDDRWLPGRDSACIISLKKEEASNWVVANLLSPRENGWDEQVVDALFLPFKAYRIKGIPLCVTDQEDCITWPRCRSGSYSLKTGYQLLCETELTAVPSCSSSDKVKIFWKCIWRLKVPSKVKVFFWCACFDAFPTKVNLKRRKVLDNSVVSYVVAGRKARFTLFGIVSRFIWCGFRPLQM